jgi:uncharacterized protein (DUF1800 family)
MELSERQKIGHLLRRFAFGSTLQEMARYESIGLHKTIDEVVDYERIPNHNGVSPWQFIMQQDGNVNLDANRAAAWWAFEMASTNRPMQEKLTLFWHNHFAVSAAKVESHPTMLQHLDVLRGNANGTFRQILGAITKDPGMLRWLDTDTSVLGKPNENFAREVLELFTVGIGNYSEKDIKELARAFTGWSIRTIYSGGGDQMRLKAFLSESIEMDRPIVAASYSEGFHDDSLKTVLGRSARFDTESALDMLATHPSTAKYITKKLWGFFAYADIEPKVHERLIKIYNDSKGDIKTLMLSIATSKEFWGEKAFRTTIKSPADYVVPLVRQLGVGEMALKAQSDAAKPVDMMTSAAQGPIQMPNQTVLGAAEFTYSAMRRMGMRLLYPPDVSGWEWGAGWVAPAMMAERMRFGTMIANRGRMAAVSERIRKSLAETSLPDDAALVDYVLRMFDADFPNDKRMILIEAVRNSGGVAAMQRNQTAMPVMQNLFRLVFGAPDFQLC